MRVLVVGGGVIGASCAAFLAERGATVAVVDAEAPRFGTSLQNAGHIVVSHSVPFAAPGMVRHGLRSLLTHDGAFAFSSRPGRGTLGWLVDFARHCTQRNVNALHPGLDELLHRSADLLKADDGIQTTVHGLWQVFTDSGAQDRAANEAAHLRAHGVHVRELSVEEIRSEPAFTDRVNAGIELTEDFGVDPAAVWRRMRQRSEIAGATWIKGAVLDLREPRILEGEVAHEYPCDAVIIAAGAWSPSIARKIGLNLPIKAAKGYSVTLDAVEKLPGHPMLLMDQRTAVNAIDGRLRMSARYELTTADDRAIVQHRIVGLIDRARAALHLPMDVGTLNAWTGVRPASSDGAPFIGLVPGTLKNAPAVYTATGHGMIGTALAAGTADLITRTVFDEPMSPAEARLGPQRLLT